MARMRGPMPGSGDRWPQQQMVRPPHPGQVRPGKLKVVHHFYLTLLTFSMKLKGNSAAFSKTCTTANPGIGQRQKLCFSCRVLSMYN